VLQVWAVQGVSVEGDRHSVVERHTMFRRLASALRGSHSNTHSVYTKCSGMLSATDQEAVANATCDLSEAAVGSCSLIFEPAPVAE